jgi:hypothetical protein
MPSGDPFGEMGRLGADGGAVAVPGVYPGLLGQCEQPIADGIHDGGKVRELPSGGTRPTAEQGVAGEQDPGLGHIQAARPR